MAASLDTYQPEPAIFSKIFSEDPSEDLASYTNKDYLGGGETFEAQVPNVTKLIDAVGGMRPEPRDVQLRGRYLREAGLLPPSEKNPRAPQVDAVHSVILLLSVLSAVPQSNVPEAVRTLWTLRGEGPPIGSEISEAFPKLRLTTFGEQITGFLELMILGHMHPRPGQYIRTGGFSEAAVWRGRSLALIATETEHRRFFDEPTFAAPNPVRDRQIDTVTTAPPFALETLAALVAQSRMDAERLGVTIPTADAWQALGVEPLELR